MIVQELLLKNYRNIAMMQLLLCESVNVLYGENGQGKTNLLEAIWLFTGRPSFRGSKSSELVRFQEKQADLLLSFQDEREQTAQIRMGATKQMSFNGVSYASAAQVAGKFMAVVFSPSHLAVFRDGPRARRRLLDEAICQMKPQYNEYLDHYEKLLFQRNALLKNYRNHSDLAQLMDPWDLQLAKTGTIITAYRNEYMQRLNEVTQQIYRGLSREKEELQCRYVSTVFQTDQIFTYEDSYIDQYYRCLQQSIVQDQKMGYTTLGVHRDDIEFSMNGLSMKTFGSQGQQRSCIVAIKIAQAKLMQVITKEKPVILLDDVMSELDIYRQEYILNQLEQWQVLITCCDPSNILSLKQGKTFLIHAGELKDQQIIGQAGE